MELRETTCQSISILGLKWQIQVNHVSSGCGSGAYKASQGYAKRAASNTASNQATNRGISNYGTRDLIRISDVASPAHARYHPLVGFLVPAHGPVKRPP